MKINIQLLLKLLLTSLLHRWVCTPYLCPIKHKSIIGMTNNDFDIYRLVKYKNLIDRNISKLTIIL